MSQPDGNVLCIWDDGVRKGVHRFRFATIRRDYLPQIELGGELRDIDLKPSEGLYEPTHVCIFADGRVGTEFNFFGPRPSRLAYYMERASVGDCPNFRVEPLLRRDVSEKLQRMQDLVVFDLTVREPWIDTVEQLDATLGRAMRAAQQAGGARVVRLQLRPEPYKRNQRLSRGLLRSARRLAGRNDLREQSPHFEVKGVNEAGSTEWLNVLNDELVETAKIERIGRSRTPQKNAAYAAIERAYANKRVDLERASTASVT